MLTLLAAFAMASSLAAPSPARLATITLVPTDDVWVYAHASDPGGDLFLRIWGAEGKAAPANADEAGDLSMGYLKWNLDALPALSHLKSAKLVVYNIANPGFSVEQAKATPLQARLIDSSFTEKTWTFEGVSKLLPKTTPEAVLGTGFPESIPKDSPVEISLDLLKGPADFKKAIGEALASPSHSLGLAVTSVIDMATLGNAGVFKIYSRNAELEKNRPKLVLEFTE